jgi:hypothetical protein
LLDALYVLVLVAFFALMAGFVRACDWIIGSDEQAEPVTLGAEEERTAA